MRSADVSGPWSRSDHTACPVHDVEVSLWYFSSFSFNWEPKVYLVIVTLWAETSFQFPVVIKDDQSTAKELASPINSLPSKDEVMLPWSTAWRHSEGEPGLSYSVSHCHFQRAEPCCGRTHPESDADRCRACSQTSLLCPASSYSAPRYSTSGSVVYLYCLFTLSTVDR